MSLGLGGNGDDGGVKWLDDGVSAVASPPRMSATISSNPAVDDVDPPAAEVLEDDGEWTLPLSLLPPPP